MEVFSPTPPFPFARLIPEGPSLRGYTGRNITYPKSNKRKTTPSPLFAILFQNEGGGVLVLTFFVRCILLFFVSYYRQLSADLKMENYKIKTSGPSGLTKLVLILLIYFNFRWKLSLIRGYALFISMAQDQF